MTEKLQTHSFCNDNGVVTVLFFKKDGSVQNTSCYSQEKCYSEDTIVLDDIVLIARLMSGGSIDYPYASGDVVSQVFTTIIEVTTGNPGEQQLRVRYSKVEVPLARCDDMQLNDFKVDADGCVRRRLLHEGREVCERACWVVEG